MLLGREDLFPVKRFSQFLFIFLFMSMSFIKEREWAGPRCPTAVLMLDESAAQTPKL